MAEDAIRNATVIVAIGALAAGCAGGAPPSPRGGPVECATHAIGETVSIECTDGTVGEAPATGGMGYGWRRGKMLELYVRLVDGKYFIEAQPVR